MAQAQGIQIELSLPSWADLVFHVLAHVPTQGSPASLYAPWYVQFAERALGPVAERPLGADLALLAAMLRASQTLVAVQGLAWLWRQSASALAASETELAQLRSDDLAERALLAALLPHLQEVELLRCAALLEAETHQRLPAPAVDAAALGEALAELLPHAPALANLTVTPIRSLTYHGRVRGSALWIGVPGEGVSLEHAAMQAAHEASVHEVVARHAGRAPRPVLSERQLEAVALVLLSERIRGSSHEAAHRTWCRHWQVRDEHLEPTALSPALHALLTP